MEALLRNKKALLIISIITLVILTLLTRYQGTTDVGDYSDTAKYFAGDFPAKIRSSHSYFLGLVMSPFVKLTQSFIFFKILSLVLLLSLVYSVYLASGKNKNALWLMLFSPILWYMAPWINPIQLASLLFFLAYISIKKYEKSGKLLFLVLSGILIGLSWTFWDAILFFFIIFLVSFFYNKKVPHLILFILSVLIGLLPKLILDQIIFNFVFIGIIRYFFGLISSILFSGVYGTMGQANILLRILPILFFFPLFSYKLFSQKNFIENRGFYIFILLSILLIIGNTQIRYLFLLIPIIMLELAPMLNHQQVKKQLIFSVIVILFVSVPYIIQIKYSTNAEEFSSLLSNINHISISKSQTSLINQDLINLTSEFKGEVFVVGNAPDDFQVLAHNYWGKDVKEFASIQDYQLVLENKSILFQKTFMPIPKIAERRQIWISGGISKNTNDKTNYSLITYGIGINKPLNLTGFELIKKYNLLYLSKKESIQAHT